jgi:hypothetical protein
MFNSGVKGLIFIECGCTMKLVILDELLSSQSYFIYCIVSECVSRSKNILFATDTNIPGMHILNSALN